MSYERNQIIGLLFRIFEAEQYHWSIDGEYKVPSYKEIDDCITDIECRLESERLLTIESGRIRVDRDKEDGVFTYYLSLGYTYGG
jgi:hypothetical protein